MISFRNKQAVYQSAPTNSLSPTSPTDLGQEEVRNSILLRFSLVLIVGLLVNSATLPAAEDDSVASDSETISSVARPFFEQHCLRCHGPSQAKGDLRLDQLDVELARPAIFERWRQIVERVQADEMPPENEPRPAPEQTSDFVKRLTVRLDAAAAKHDLEGRVVLRRLNRVEYENTLNDLFAVNVSIRDMLPEDAVAQGFDNVGAALNVSPVLIERYLDAADAVLDAAIAPVHQLESTSQRFDLYDSLPGWFVAGVWKQNEGVILFRTSGNGSAEVSGTSAGPLSFSHRRFGT